MLQIAVSTHLASIFINVHAGKKDKHKQSFPRTFSTSSHVKCTLSTSSHVTGAHIWKDTHITPILILPCATRFSIPVDQKHRCFPANSSPLRVRHFSGGRDFDHPALKSDSPKRSSISMTRHAVLSQDSPSDAVFLSTCVRTSAAPHRSCVRPP